MDRISQVLDTGQFPRTHVAAKQQRRELDVQLATLKRSFLANLDMSDEEVEDAKEAAINEALGRPARWTRAAPRARRFRNAWTPESNLPLSYAITCYRASPVSTSWLR